MITDQKGSGTRSVKRTESARVIQKYMKEYFLKTREKAIQGEPFVFSDIMLPVEILVAMDIPYVGNMWWFAMMAAKRLVGFYDEIDAKNNKDKGYDRLGYCSRCSGKWTHIIAQDKDHAPYGGLPDLRAIFFEDGNCVGEEKASELNLRDLRRQGYHIPPIFTLEASATAPFLQRYPRWWEKINDHWDEVIEPYRIDHMVGELERAIKFLEVTTGKTLRQDRLEKALELSNETLAYWGKVRELLAKTSPCPIDVPDHLANYTALFHRGTTEARDLSKIFYEGVREKVESGEGAYPNEKIRLHWMRGGYYGDAAFYQHFAKQYGAVFVSSWYSSLPSQAYLRKPLGDPLRALASRQVFLGIYSGPEWEIDCAQTFDCQGAVILRGHCPWAGSVPPKLTKLAFEKAGIPALVADDSKGPASLRDQVASFIESRLS